MVETDFPARRSGGQSRPIEPSAEEGVLRPDLPPSIRLGPDDGNVRLEFKKPWSDGTACVDLEPLAFIARLAVLVPPPRRHWVRNLGVLLSHAAARREVVPAPAAMG